MSDVNNELVPVLCEKIADTVASYCKPTAALVLEHARTSRPIVIAGVMDGWAARSWSFESLRRDYGRVTLKRIDDRDVLLGDHIDRILASKTFTTGGGNIPDALEDDVGIPFVTDLFTTGSFKLFLAATGSITPLHSDPLDGLNAHIIGAKVWLLFSPDQARYLYPKGLDVFGRVRGCAVNPYNFDANRYPEFVHARPLSVTVKPGEILLIPTGWFHAVKYVEPAVSINCPMLYPSV